jgi:hypothetical protein
LVWFVFKDNKKVVISTIFCFLITFWLPVKNYLVFGQFVYSDWFNDVYNNYFLKSGIPLWKYPFYSLFANNGHSHWLSTFIQFGYYKRELSGLHSSFIAYLTNIFFVLFYVFFYLRFFYNSIKRREWVELTWVSYFLIPTAMCHEIGGRCRLPFEFLIY